MEILEVQVRGGEEGETDTSTRWSQVRVGGEPLSYKNETDHI